MRDFSFCTLKKKYVSENVCFGYSFSESKVVVIKTTSLNRWDSTLNCIYGLYGL